MFRSKPVNVTRLSPLLRRGYVMGYRRARHKARAEMRSMAAHFDAEIEALQHELESRPGSTGLMDGA
jgi:hypothetical protein